MTQLLNIGSLTKIEVALAENITLGTPNDDNEVVVTNSDTWDDINFTRQSASFTQNEKPVNEGSRFDSGINWNLPKLGAANHGEAHKYYKKEVVIRFTDANAQVYIIGSAKVPAFILVNSYAPPEPGGYNGYKFTVKYQSTHSVYFVA